MPKVKKQAPKNTNSDIRSLVKKNEFLIGTATLVIAAAVIGVSLAKLDSENQSIKTPIQTVNTTIEPAATTSAVMEAVKVTKLSHTASDNSAFVLKGDSYFRITKRICGSGKNYMLISEMNGNRDLHPGESIKISCSL